MTATKTQVYKDDETLNRDINRSYLEEAVGLSEIPQQYHKL